MTEIEDMLDDPKRGNIRYIYPVEDIETIAKMISALANSEGGTLLLGVYDDGLEFEIKGYSFGSFNREEISKILNGFELFMISEHYVNEAKVIKIDVQKESSGVIYDGTMYEYFDDYHNRMRELRKAKVFISYNHATAELADIIEENIKSTYGLRVEISRDTQLEYRDDIDKFMRSIKENDVIISLVTKKYLESEACMFEVTELMRDENYSKRLAFIIIDKEDTKFIKSTLNPEELLPEVYGEQRFDYLDYWINAKERYANRLKNLVGSSTSVTDLAAQTHRIGRIADEVGSFLNLLNKLMGRNFSTMSGNNFNEIKKMIDSKLNDEIKV